MIPSLVLSLANAASQPHQLHQPRARLWRACCPRRITSPDSALQDIHGFVPTTQLSPACSQPCRSRILRSHLPTGRVDWRGCLSSTIINKCPTTT
ncbi:hypothetical protein K491DRAFT_409601 [Lophiostoma macrostomum CBS 122681]|uniref:Uncharacterized protein n=1 Tax=Lophiostoma macrostomum CBS 122681 TaxID=1314788 RepID=A0A6A6TA76_9PLEO|nr:hypothetical protein K491DRAFT_409601 [Lophiostoma macrostomum CBS 122681]